MSQILKHRFEAVSLLTAENGKIDVSIIPAHNQPNWLIPTSLILGIYPFEERVWSYEWQGEFLAVYHLLPKQIAPKTVVVIEGNSDIHRLALQTTGALSSQKVAISDIKDTTLPSDVAEHMRRTIPSLHAASGSGLDYIYQAVMLKGELYLIPDIDKITHHLVDLDS